MRKPPVGGLGSVRLGHGYAIPTPPSPTFLLLRETAYAVSFIAKAKTSIYLCALSDSLKKINKIELKG